MDQDAQLRLELVDVYGKRLAENVDVILRHTEFSQVVAARNANARNRLTLKDLFGPPRGLYRTFIDPPSYLPVTSMVNLSKSGLTDRVFVFAADPEKVLRVQFPDWAALTDAQPLLDASKKVLGFEGKSGRELYEGLDDIRRAGLLNILAKARRVGVGAGTRVIDFLQELKEIRGDRFFVSVPHALREHVKNATHDGAFAEAPSTLHHPPEGFASAGSFKTPDRYGNLQLTFFARADEWVADIDIDDANGLEHVFQVVRNSVTGSPTHPYNIQQILIKEQEIDPGYTLLVREPATRAATA